MLSAELPVLHTDIRAAFDSLIESNSHSLHGTVRAAVNRLDTNTLRGMLESDTQILENARERSWAANQRTMHFVDVCQRLSQDGSSDQTILGIAQDIVAQYRTEDRMLSAPYRDLLNALSDTGKQALLATINDELQEHFCPTFELVDLAINSPEYLRHDWNRACEARKRTRGSHSFSVRSNSKDSSKCGNRGAVNSNQTCRFNIADHLEFISADEPVVVRLEFSEPQSIEHILKRFAEQTVFVQVAHLRSPEQVASIGLGAWKDFETGMRGSEERLKNWIVGKHYLTAKRARKIKVIETRFQNDNQTTGPGNLNGSGTLVVSQRELDAFALERDLIVLTEIRFAGLDVFGKAGVIRALIKSTSTIEHAVLLTRADLL